MSNYGANASGFKRKTYIDILQDMENKAKELFGEDVNLNEQSPMALFIQSVAWELSNTWEELENSYSNTTLLNAIGVPLDNITSNFGKVRFQGTKARGIIKALGEDGTLIEEGFVISTGDGLLFETVEDAEIVDGEALIEVIAVDIGIEYNIPANTITEIENPIAGLDSVMNEEEIKGGSNIERDDLFRARVLEALREPTTGDNIAQYRQWAKEVAGVGNLKVLPTTPSVGYTTLIIADIDGNVPTEDLLAEVLAHIEEVKPINAGIYVEGVESKAISIDATIRLAEGYEMEQVKEEFEKNIKEYFKSIVLIDTYVSYAQIGKILLETKGLFDYNDLMISGVVGNVELGDKEAPILDTVTLEVV